MPSKQFARAVRKIEAVHFLLRGCVIHGVIAAVLIAATQGESPCAFDAARVKAPEAIWAQSEGETHVNITITKRCPPYYTETQEVVVRYIASRDNDQNQTLCQLQVDDKKHVCSPYNAYCTCAEGDGNRTVYRVVRNVTNTDGEVWYFTATYANKEQLHTTIRVIGTGVRTTQHKVQTTIVTTGKISVNNNDSPILAIAVASASVIIVITTVAVACHYRRKTLVVTYKCPAHVPEEPLAQKRATLEERSKSLARVTPPPLPESIPVPPPVPPSELIPYDVSEPYPFPHGDPTLVDGPPGKSGVRTFMPPTYLEHTVEVSLNTNTATAYFTRHPVQFKTTNTAKAEFSPADTTSLVYSSITYHEPWDNRPSADLVKSLSRHKVSGKYDDLSFYEEDTSTV